MVEGRQLSGQQPIGQVGNEAVETSGIGEQLVWGPKLLSKEQGAIVSWDSKCVRVEQRPILAPLNAAAEVNRHSEWRPVVREPSALSVLGRRRVAVDADPVNS